ncbi:hypothetical protein [Caldisphaera lagunensis]|nr:hypothetical protein [Caldisphaera lagunensis]
MKKNTNEIIRLLKSANYHLNNGDYGISCYESRLSAIYSMEILANYLNIEINGSNLREIYKQINKIVNLSSIRYCIDYLDSLKNLEVNYCDTYCSDEIPGAEVLDYVNYDDSFRAYKCSNEIKDFVFRIIS